MLRGVACGLIACAALAGCATLPPEPIPSRPRAPPAQPAPQGDASAFVNAPGATLFSELFVCSPTDSNIGPIGARNESLVYTPYITTPAGPLLRNPTQGACLSSGYGWRGTADGGGSEHTGIDLANPNGDFIYAAADGTVVYTGWARGYGLVVMLDHGRGVRSFYGHLSEVSPLIGEGTLVRSGTAIARMGMTGNATGVHLHYEVSIDGERVDPLNYGAPNVTAVGQTHTPPEATEPETEVTQTPGAPPDAESGKPDKALN
jgi:murein DD-endopeptidase MepM/ murein hydrolase activator NlpD